MSLVNNNSKLFAFSSFHLLVDNRKLLQGCDYYALSVVDCISKGFRFPLAVHLGLVINGDYASKRVVKAGNSFLQLLVQNLAVCDDYHRIEHRPVIVIKKRGKTVSYPCNAVAFSRACAVFYKIVFSTAVFLYIGDNLTHNVQLMIARKYNSFYKLSFFLALAVYKSFLVPVKMNELLENIQQLVFLKNFFPYI